jgi:hypothetical protein
LIVPALMIYRCSEQSLFDSGYLSEACTIDCLYTGYKHMIESQ